MQFLKRTWADVDLDAIEYNLGSIRKKIGDTKIIAVVKADAYGHGASVIAGLYNRLGIDFFAVSSIDEARLLRTDNITGDILILGYTPPDMARELNQYGITQSALDYSYAKKLSDNAVNAGIILPIHVKIDSGMSRLGIVCRGEGDICACADEVEKIAALPNIRITGIFTHFSSADGETAPGSDDAAFTMNQFRIFKSITDLLALRGINTGIRHCSNSAAIINYPETYLDAVRPGIILYGYYPDSVDGSKMADKISLKPSMTLKSVVSQVKELPAGSRVSYGGEYHVENESKFAVVPVGYADGFIRRNSNGGTMYIKGIPSDIAGRICMDMCMLDISGRDDVYEGDEVVIFGKGGNSLEKIAEICQTINYELTCLIGKRVPRIY